MVDPFNSRYGDDVGMRKKFIYISKKKKQNKKLTKRRHYFVMNFTKREY